MFSLVDIGYLQCLFKYTSRCWEVFLIGQIFFYSGGLGANRNVSGKLGMKLAIKGQVHVFGGCVKIVCYMTPMKDLL